MKTSFNWLAIIVATFAGMFIGFLFYGLLFQEQWSEAVGLTSEGENFFKYGEAVVLDPVTPMIVNFVLMFGYALFMNWLTAKTGSLGFTEGAGLGAVIGLILAASHTVGNMFALEPVSLSMIDGVYHLVLFAVIGGIVGGWRKK